MNFTDPAIISALSVGTSIVTTILIKPWIDHRFYQRKLNIEFQYEQRKKIKEVLAKYKVPLIKVCNEVNERYWNFQENYSKGWLNAEGNFDQSGYYFKSFVYRILAVFAWIKIIEGELIFLDTTIASKKDLELLKYFRLIKDVFTSVQLYKTFNYDQSSASDHIFRNQLEDMSEAFMQDGKVITSSEFNKNFSSILPAIKPFCAFLDNINPEINKLRWDRFHLFHIALIGFVNSYGYDFQQVDKNTILKINARLGKNGLLENFQEHINYFKLNGNKELILIMNTLR
jgi:hypothetical protein